MRRLCPILLLVGLSLVTAPAAAQRHAGFARWPATDPAAGSTGSRAVTVPDRVRRHAGYQHWKGAAIGGGAGAALGTLLSLAATASCSDCTITTWDRVQTALLVGAGGAAFGFLVGSTSPRYAWETRPDTSSAAAR